MWIVAIGWAYVVILMAATETSVIAGIMTFFGYCVLPLSILFYLAGAGRRRRRRADASARSSADDSSLPAGIIPPYMPLTDGAATAADCAASGADGGGNGGCGGGGD